MRTTFCLLALLALAGCAPPTVCDRWCERIDVCSGIDNAATCKDSYAQSLSANPTVTAEACQAGLDELDAPGGCAADDDDSSS